MLVRRHTFRVSASVLSLLFAAGAPTPGGAQAPPRTADLAWVIEDTRQGWCLQFLIDPDHAKDNLPHAVRPAPVYQAPTAHPAILRLVGDEPRYAEWVPSIACSFFAQAIVVDGRRVGGPKEKNPQGLVWWGVLATPKAPTQSGTFYALRLLGANNARVKELSAGQSIYIDQVDMATERIADKPDQHFMMKYGKTTVVFDGHAAADTSLKVAPFTQEWWGQGSGPRDWRATVSFRPTSTHGLVGALRVQGRGDLADALRASPIRLVGPLRLGGDGSVIFDLR